MPGADRRGRRAGRAPEREAPARVDQGHRADGEEQAGEVGESRHPGFRSNSAGAGDDGRLVGSGPLERSPRTRLSTFSALIRHIGRPMPGTLDPPAYSRPRTRRDRFVPRRNALCRRVCAGPRAPPLPGVQVLGEVGRAHGAAHHDRAARGRAIRLRRRCARSARSAASSTSRSPVPSSPPRPIETSAGTGTQHEEVRVARGSDGRVARARHADVERRGIGDPRVVAEDVARSCVASPR